MYRLYIDETGNPDLAASRDPNHRYLSLTGVIVEQHYVKQTLTPRLNELKQEIFDPDPDEPIILHRRAILQRNRPFHALRDQKVAADFDKKLLSLLSDCEYVVITEVIDTGPWSDDRSGRHDAPASGQYRHERHQGGATAPVRHACRESAISCIVPGHDHKISHAAHRQAEGQAEAGSPARARPAD